MINAYNKKIYQEHIVEMEKSGYTYYGWNASLEELIAEFPEYQMLPLTPEVEPIQF